MSCNENKSGCGCNQGKCGCGPKNCAPKDCGPKSGCEMTDKIMCQAEKAWESLFRRKLEAEFEKLWDLRWMKLHQLLQKYLLKNINT